MKWVTIDSYCNNWHLELLSYLLCVYIMTAGMSVVRTMSYRSMVDLLPTITSSDINVYVVILHFLHWKQKEIRPLLKTRLNTSVLPTMVIMVLYDWATRILFIRIPTINRVIQSMEGLLFDLYRWLVINLKSPRIHIHVLTLLYYIWTV